MTRVQLDDWHYVKLVELRKTQPGRVLISMYKTVEAAVRNGYPNYPWDASRFVACLPRGYWKDENNLLLSIERAEGVLGVSKVRYINSGVVELNLNHSPRIGILLQWLIWRH